MKTFAIFNVKGGVAKTTTSTTLAHIFATEFNKRVLIVDLDPQSNTTALLGNSDVDLVSLLQQVFLQNDLSVLKTYDRTIGDLLVNADLDIHEVIQPTQYPNLDLLPAFLDLAEIEERLKADIRIPQQFRLKAHLDKVADEYDYCILDLSPSVNIININGLVVADHVFTPLLCDKWGITGFCIAKNLVNTVSAYNPKLKLSGCFFCQWQGNSSIAKQIREFLLAAMPDQYIDIPIRKSVKVGEMTHEHKALFDYAPRSNTASDYRKLAEYIIGKF